MQQTDPSRITILSIAQLGAHTYAIVRGQGLVSVEEDGGQEPDDGIPAATNRDAAARIGEWWAAQRPKGGEKLLLVWQPPSLLSDSVETKRVDRATFSKLENVTQAHPLIGGGSCGWGYEPLPKGQMQGRTFLHIESEPGLQAFGESIEAQGTSIGSAYSAASLILQSHTKAVPKTLLLAKEFAMIVRTPTSGTGVVIPRSNITAMAWGDGVMDPVTPSQMQHHLETAGFFSDPPSSWRVVSTEEHASQAGAFLVGESDAAGMSLWRERTSSDTLTGWETFIAACRKSPTLATSADLWDTFPRPRPLDKVFVGGAVICAIAAAYFGWQAFSTNEQIQRSSNAHRLAVANMQATVDELSTVAAKIQTGEERIAVMGASAIPRGRAELMRLLGDILPDEYTLTNLELTEDGRITLGFYQVSERGGDLVSTANRFEAYGFAQTRIEADSDKKEGLSTSGPIPPKRFRLLAVIGQSAKNIQ